MARLLRLDGRQQSAREEAAMHSRGTLAAATALAALALMLFAQPAGAVDTPAAAGSQGDAAVGVFGSAGGPGGELAGWGEPTDIPWSRVIGGTGIVVALICGGIFLLKKLNGGLPLSRGRYLEVVESRPLGRGVQLFLVKVAGKAVLLAASGGNVTTVAELPDDALEQIVADEPAESAGFASLLRKLAGVTQ
jgi:flagellar biogenesis protein FliO